MVHRVHREHRVQMVARDLRGLKGLMGHRDLRALVGWMELKVSPGILVLRDPVDLRDPRNPVDLRDPRDSVDLRDPRDPVEMMVARDLRDPRGHRDPVEMMAHQGETEDMEGMVMMARRDEMVDMGMMVLPENVVPLVEVSLVHLGGRVIQAETEWMPRCPHHLTHLLHPCHLHLHLYRPHRPQQSPLLPHQSLSLQHHLCLLLRRPPLATLWKLTVPYQRALPASIQQLISVRQLGAPPPRGVARQRAEDRRDRAYEARHVVDQREARATATQERQTAARQEQVNLRRNPAPYPPNQPNFFNGTTTHVPPLVFKPLIHDDQ
ncbi:hypothetical protein JKP88DRAFT_282673 [Tribonema minus]|uniref:Uncharacterized protein n=1 Tax=Tribonema minus TaxID=303371 RepID=A0A835YT72_9STRA|nr:hypothetical protein JKP88DRAFT_282673 [Tribonema minus]